MKKRIWAIKKAENEEKLFTVFVWYGVWSNTLGDWHRNKTKPQKYFTYSASSAADKKPTEIT